MREKITSESIPELVERRNGQRFNGRVSIRDYDQGIIESLGAEIVENLEDENHDPGYYVKIPGVLGGPNSPRSRDSEKLLMVPVKFALPEETLITYEVPIILITPESMQPAYERWHPGTIVYRTKSKTADTVTINGKTGFTEVEEIQQTVPYDLIYSIQALAVNRGGLTGMSASNAIFAIKYYIQSKFPPACAIFVTDSIGDQRSYDAICESMTRVDSSSETGRRMMGFSFTLRILGVDDDIHQPYTVKTVLKTETRRSLK